MQQTNESVPSAQLHHVIERLLGVPVDEFGPVDHEKRLYSSVFSIDVVAEGRLRPLIIKTWSNDHGFGLQVEAIKRARRLFDHDSNIRIPFLGYDTDNRMMVMERVRDDSIESLTHCSPSIRGLNLIEWRRRLTAACHSAGRWLRAWHDLDAGYANIGELLSDYLHGRNKDLELLDSDERAGLGRLIDDLGTGRVCAVHGDFTPWNVLWSPQQLTVLDFGIGEWSRMTPGWDYQTMQIGLATELLFATRSPARWFKPLVKAPLHAFDKGYGKSRCSADAMNACAAVRHFNLYTADIQGDSSVRKRAEWHRASLNRILKNT